MSLPRALASSFSAYARDRGRRLAGHVRFAWRRGRVSASVRDADSTYSVALALGRASVCATCSCPSFQLGLDGCRHLWAALLAADRLGISSTLPRRIAPHGRVARLALRGAPAIVFFDTTSRARIETLSEVEGNRERLADAMSAATLAAIVDPPIPPNGPRGRSTTCTDRVGRWKRETR